LKRESSIYSNPNLLVAFGVTLMGIMGVSLIAPTLPVMARALGVPDSSIGLAITAFTLPGVVLAIFAGITGRCWSISAPCWISLFTPRRLSSACFSG